MKFKGGHFAIGAPLAEFKGGHGAPVPPRSAAYVYNTPSFSGTWECFADDTVLPSIAERVN